MDLGAAESHGPLCRPRRPGQALIDGRGEGEEEGEDPESDASTHAARRIARLLASFEA